MLVSSHNSDAVAIVPPPQVLHGPTYSGGSPSTSDQCLVVEASAGAICSSPLVAPCLRLGRREFDPLVAHPFLSATVPMNDRYPLLSDIGNKLIQKRNPRCRCQIRASPSLIVEPGRAT